MQSPCIPHTPCMPCVHATSVLACVSETLWRITRVVLCIYTEEHTPVLHCLPSFLLTCPFFHQQHLLLAAEILNSSFHASHVVTSSPRLCVWDAIGSYLFGDNSDGRGTLLFLWRHQLQSYPFFFFVAFISLLPHCIPLPLM